MKEIEWIKQHKELILEYSKLKNKKKLINLKMKEISKKLNKLDEELLR